MRKLPVFVLAAATLLTVAGVPMTAQAAICQTSGSSNYVSSCNGQTGNINSILSQLGCNSSSNGKSCTTGSTCTNGSSCSTKKSSNSCSNSKNTRTSNTGQCKSSYSNCR